MIDTLFTFKLEWVPDFITGRNSSKNHLGSKVNKKTEKNAAKTEELPASTAPKITGKQSFKQITVQELAKHNKHNDCWIAIHNKVYDVTKWADTHPGGDIIKLGGGTNATAMFEMYHPRMVHHAILEKYVVGKMEQDSFPTYYDWENDVFYKTMKDRVVRKLTSLNIDNWHDSPKMYLKTFVIMMGWCLSLYYMWHGSFLAASFLGIFSSMVGTCIMHDACHGAYSKYQWVNRLMAWGMDMIGASTYVWEFHHNTGHHPFTNLVSGEDRDGQENDPDVFSSYPLIRMTPHDALKPHHKWQWLYATPVFGGFTMIKVFYSDISALLSGKITQFISMEPRLSSTSNKFRIVMMKICSLGYMLVIPIYYNGALKGFVLFAIAHFFCGMILAIMFIVTHITDHCEFLKNETNKGENETGKLDSNLNNWAAIQCRTSTNWALQSAFWTYFSGGLNHQIEHHLFPSICHVYYPLIQSVVEETCHEFDVPYFAHPTLSAAFYHTLKHLYDMGNEVIVDVSGVSKQ